MESSSEIKAPKPVYVVVETEYIFFFASSSLKYKNNQNPLKTNQNYSGSNEIVRKQIPSFLLPTSLVQLELFNKNSFGSCTHGMVIGQGLRARRWVLREERIS